MAAARASGRRDGADHRAARRRPAAAGADVDARDRRDGPRLVPHGRLRVADRRRGGRRPAALSGQAGRARRRSGARMRAGHRGRARRRPRRRRGPTPRSPRPSPRPRTCSSSGRASTGSPPASSRSRSRRRRGCRRRSATSRRSSTGICPRPGPRPRWSLVLTERAGLDGAGEAGAPGAGGGRRRSASGPPRSSATDAAALIPEYADAGRPDRRPRGARPAHPAVASLLGAAGPLQLVTLAIAAARGTNPDLIRRDDARYLRAADLADDPSL